MSENDDATPPWAPWRLRVYSVPDSQGTEVGELWMWWQDGEPWLGRSRFIRPFEKPMCPDRWALIADAADDKDWVIIDAMEPNALPWFCPICRCSYPEESWQLVPRWKADGRPETYVGVCPKGHERVIAE